MFFLGCNVMVFIEIISKTNVAQVHMYRITDSSLELFVYYILFRCIRNTMFSTVYYQI